MLFLAVMMFPLSVSGETVRTRGNRHFSRIKWTPNYEHVVPKAVEGRSLPGGNESYAALVLASRSEIGGIYPRVEGLGSLAYDGIETNLLETIQTLCDSLYEKTADPAVFVKNRRFLSILTEYRLKRIPSPEYVFFSRPEGTVTNGKKTTIALQTGKEGIKKVLYLHVYAELEDSLWKISDIQFDSESYADFPNKN